MKTKVIAWNYNIERWITTLVLLTLGALACSTISTAYATSLEIARPQAAVEASRPLDGIQMFQDAAPDLAISAPFSLPAPLPLDLVERVNQMFLSVFEADVYNNQHISPIKKIDAAALTHSNKTAFAQIEKLAASKRLLATAAAGSPDITIGDNPDYLQYKNIMFRTDI